MERRQPLSFQRHREPLTCLSRPPGAGPGYFYVRPRLNTAVRFQSLFRFPSGSASLLTIVICNNIFGADDCMLIVEAKKRFPKRKTPIRPVENTSPHRVAKSTTGSEKRVTKSTILDREPCRQVHYRPRETPASHTEVSREAMRGRSRRRNGSRKTRVRLWEGTALAELRPRAPALAPA